ncbi:MAG: hypothetical protein DLM52_06420 [Chthoniobacterales bacterium]|nr:MAG: hypothetical protein DLM52_06420 [Chthoniobacterales bacterium]
MIFVIGGRAKLIVSPEAAVAIACRRVQVVPGQVPPESPLLLTVIVAARAAPEHNVIKSVIRQIICFFISVPVESVGSRGGRDGGFID